MGLICIALKIPKGINIGFLLGLLDSLKFVVMVALARLGLLNSPEQVADAEEDHSTDSTIRQNNYVLVMDGLSPSLIPLQSLMGLIKKTLSVMEYSNLLERYGAHDDEDHVDRLCSVCLNCVERIHEVREQPNCCHVFHRECLDRWVDEGRVTCPLCRSLLFPARGESTRSGRNIDHFVG
ncbi:E3 ubiquitin-protein ligase RHA2B-like [Corylus avellana]|uniref:E3 ubiquitin-protein ligase RHA2B-like n=1 Tax=Corylus avellana TaxID=13451 RepID=UPI00286B7662|nr:E3 ubiquitin-protein ligase RHA2B-like [Corylus avellana]